MTRSKHTPQPLALLSQPKLTSWLAAGLTLSTKQKILSDCGDLSFKRLSYRFPSCVSICRSYSLGFLFTLFQTLSFVSLQTVAISSMLCVQPFSLAKLEKLSQSCSRFCPLATLLWVKNRAWPQCVLLRASRIPCAVRESSKLWGLVCPRMTSASSLTFSNSRRLSVKSFATKLSCL